MSLPFFQTNSLVTLSAVANAFSLTHLFLCTAKQKLLKQLFLIMLWNLLSTVFITLFLCADSDHLIQITCAALHTSFILLKDAESWIFSINLGGKMHDCHSFADCCLEKKVKLKYSNFMLCEFSECFYLALLISYFIFMYMWVT